MHISLKNLVEYLPPMINENVPLSSIFRDNWTSLLQLTRAIENASKDKVSPDDILASLVQMKLASELIYLY